ncbi:MAG: heat-inducible transcriptional repressor HrcA, partial [Rhizobiales bacterium]|nr:heat-inducible transcriptional repressor HrcA [Hyphomicrobiales bacterium]
MPVDRTTSETATSALSALDQRSREIFRRIVDSYLETGEPLGSRNLARILPMALSPASVRNVMSDLEGLGLIYAPHTSAGRLPTESGLRLFVDAMLEVGDLTSEERRDIESRVAGGGGGRTVDGVLSEAGRMLSGLSRGAGVV